MWFEWTKKSVLYQNWKQHMFLYKSMLHLYGPGYASTIYICSYPVKWHQFDSPHACNWKLRIKLASTEKCRSGALCSCTNWFGQANHTNAYDLLLTYFELWFELMHISKCLLPSCSRYFDVLRTHKFLLFFTKCNPFMWHTHDFSNTVNLASLLAGALGRWSSLGQKTSWMSSTTSPLGERW
jgi:hypothetical protein